MPPGFRWLVRAAGMASGGNRCASRWLVAGSGGWMVSGAIGAPPGSWWLVPVAGWYQVQSVRLLVAGGWFRWLDGIRCNRCASWWLVVGSGGWMVSGAIGAPPGGWWLVPVAGMASGAIGAPPGGWWLVPVAGWHQVQSVRLPGDLVAYFRQPAGRSGPQAYKCGGAVLLERQMSKGCRCIRVFSDIQLFIFSSRDVKNKRALSCDVKS